MDNNDNDIEQFLFDVREHFRASLETSEYENTSNIFHVTAADATGRLLERCEFLLERCLSKKQFYNELPATTPIPVSPQKHMPNDFSEQQQQLNNPKQEENVSYMDMSANCKKAASIPIDYTELQSSTDSDKTFRCSTRLASNRHESGHHTNVCTVADVTADGGDDCHQIYDICHVTQQELPTDETQMVMTAEVELIQSPDCPYKDLPAGHLPIQHSSKYGQLQRIEKRLFFDQSKKCYCGIIEDWLLVYVDGPTSCSPTITLHLKTPGIEIEHFGEGKRRDICFQITTADPNKKFVFQANNEVDAKEWIHAVEAAIRGDAAATGVSALPSVTASAALATVNKSTRKLPTPPIIKKMNFLGNGSVQQNITSSNSRTNSNDCIYEEPSPLYEIQDQLPALPEKFNSPAAMARKYEYDVPKCPAQPLRLLGEHSIETENETAGLLHAQAISTPQQPPLELALSTPSSLSASLSEKSNDFQAKIKDVHSKLSSQLTAGPLKKVTKKGYTNTPTQDTEPPIIGTPVSTPIAIKEQKKQKKSTSATTTPTTSPQKFMQIATSSPPHQQEKTTRNWFLNRLNKSTSSMRNSSSQSTTTTFTTSPSTKSKQSEKENLLNGLDFTDGFDATHAAELSNRSSSPTTPTLKCAGKSKVNMIINQLEASGHLATMFSVETLASNALATFSAAFCESDCNNYEPIMTVSPPPSSFLKKV